MATIIKPNYPAASSALTVTNLLSLASDTNLLAGWSSAVQDNTANLSIDEIISGTIRTGTSPTAQKSIEIWAWTILDDTPTYPDTITGLEALKTLSSAEVKGASAFALLQSILINSSSNIVYPFSRSLSNAFGFMPKKWGLWIAQNSGAALNAAGSVINRTPIQYQSV